MEAALAKIRPRTTSSLVHQKIPATLLVSLESTLREKQTNLSPTAYFSALSSRLESTINRQQNGSYENDILQAELYLLALIASFVPIPFMQVNLNSLLMLTAHLFPSLEVHAPALRSQFILYQAIFKAVGGDQLEAPELLTTFTSILQFCTDSRPKVRKKAAEVIKEVLSVPPAPLAYHPYAKGVSEWAKNTLSGAANRFFKPRESDSVLAGPEKVIHIVGLLRSLIADLPPPSIPAIVENLLALPYLGNLYLSQSVFSFLSELFLLAAEVRIFEDYYIFDVLEAVLSVQPTKSDTFLIPAWIGIVGDIFLLYSGSDDNTYAKKLGKTWQVVMGFLESNDSRTREAAAKSLCTLCRSFKPTFIAGGLQNTDSSSPLEKIVTRLMNAFDSPAYTRSFPELLSVVASLILHLRYRPTPTSPTASQTLLSPLIVRIGDLRSQKGFKYIEDVDRALAAAMRVLGPEALLEILPLEIEPSYRQAGSEPRAYLLSLLPNPHPSPLGHFVSYFVPLTERMFDWQSAAEAQGRQSEAKVWNVLVTQIWAGLAGYCWGTRDLKEAFTPSLVQLLSHLLYSQPQLRPAILKALKAVVDYNLSPTYPKEDFIVNVYSEPISSFEAAENILYLQGQAETWLAVLINVFGSVGPDVKSQVGEVIGVWASISETPVIAKSYKKVVELFRANIKPPSIQNGPKCDLGILAAMTQDLFIILLPYLDPASASSLFDLCMTREVLGGNDHSVQKRGYKILTKLVQSGEVPLDASLTIQKLDALSEGLAPAARKCRFHLLSVLITLLPSSSLHLIPALISEAVLGTKEPSAKARNAAFELIVTMARKMSQGGLIKRDLIDGMDGDDSSATTANLEEFVTMLSGGLSASPHMVSAIVMSISRVLFEFNDTISYKLHSDTFATLLAFLTSTNREIVNSILGYIKLAMHILPLNIISPHLKDLVIALHTLSHDHKNHFKVKVRHIFERMIRRFGFDGVYSCAGEGEAAKLLMNIKKRKERSKRGKMAKDFKGGEENGESRAKPITGSALEDVLYGSESEEDDDEDFSHLTKGRNNIRGKGIQLRMNGDKPMDLLESVASRITRSARRPRIRQDDSYFKIDEETGKMIIDENSRLSSEEPNHYIKGLTSTDGFSKEVDTKVRFHRGTNKRRWDVEDFEVPQDTNYLKASKAKRNIEPRFGHEFKAKKAGGDLSRGGMAPYAYMTLSQAKKKGKSGRTKLGIVGKR